MNFLARLHSIMRITSKANPRIKAVVALKDKKARENRGLYTVEGIKSVKEAYLYGEEVTEVYLTEKAADSFMPDSAEVFIVTDEVFKVISDEVTPQGALAVIKRKNAERSKPTGNAVLLDGIGDAGNMGTILRTCAAAGVTDVYLLGCCDPYSPKAVRASMGGLFRVDLRFLKSGDAAEIFSDTTLVAADMNGENLFSFTPPEKFCLAVGNEANGLSEEVRKLAGRFVSVPMKNSVESLNAAVSLAVILYNLMN